MSSTISIMILCRKPGEIWQWSSPSSLGWEHRPLARGCRTVENIQPGNRSWLWAPSSSSSSSSSLYSNHLHHHHHHRHLTKQRHICWSRSETGVRTQALDEGRRSRNLYMTIYHHAYDHKMIMTMIIGWWWWSSLDDDNVDADLYGGGVLLSCSNPVHCRARDVGLGNNCHDDVDFIGEMVNHGVNPRRNPSRGGWLGTSRVNRLGPDKL